MVVYRVYVKKPGGEIVELGTYAKYPSAVAQKDRMIEAIKQGGEVSITTQLGPGLEAYYVRPVDRDLDTTSAIVTIQNVIVNED